MMGISIYLNMVFYLIKVLELLMGVILRNGEFGSLTKSYLFIFIGVF